MNPDFNDFNMKSINPLTYLCVGRVAGSLNLWQLHGTTYHPAPHRWSEEEIFVLDTEEILSMLLKGGGEELGLLTDQFLIGIEVLGDAGEKAQRGGTGRHVVGLYGKLDMQDLGIGAQHIPWHVNFQKHEFFI